jgi:DNA invertase Pin-like site-specific DNA recombinase
VSEKGEGSPVVTQQFNTTTSMGRLTLNVLLSFAQFEREATAERIRDKIAASKGYESAESNKNEIYQGPQPPLVDRELFDAVQAKLTAQCVIRPFNCE